jgi:hypothetical protein
MTFAEETIMATTQGTVYGHCAKCNTPISDAQTFGSWCLKCAEPFPPEIKAQIPRLNKSLSGASETSNAVSHVSQQFRQPQSSDGLVSAMQVIGWGNLIASVILAFIIFVNFGTAEVTRSTYPYTEKATNPLAVGTSIGIIVQGVIVLIFCLSLARILEYVSDIRSRLDKMLPEEKPLS